MSATYLLFVYVDLLWLLSSVDHSRVKLVPLDDSDDGSDYINASFIPVSTICANTSLRLVMDTVSGNERSHVLDDTFAFIDTTTTTTVLQ